MKNKPQPTAEIEKKTIREETIRKEIKESIRFVGIDRKMSGGWTNEVTEPVVDEIVEILLKRVKNMNVGVGAVPLIKNIIWELEAE